MNHILVDYSVGTFGDLLRGFISLHEGFESFTPTLHKSWFPRIQLHPNEKIVKLENIKNLEDFNLEFKKQMPTEAKYRQCYKILSNKNETDEGHSCVNYNWLEDGTIISGKPFKWDYSEYNIIRQTNHLIIFVILNPLENSRYKELFLKRHDAWHRKKYNIDNEECLKRKKNHLEVWTRNYLNYEYPKHELNYELEINNLLDKDDNTYYNMIKFLKIKPLDNWKDHVDAFDRFILSK
tara:strand:- start:287 stop:997 length:711 start_codon:yes stop_codon:yes gene_type:complete